MPNELLCRSAYHYKLNVIQKDSLKIEKQFYSPSPEYPVASCYRDELCKDISIRMLIKTSIGFFLSDEAGVSKYFISGKHMMVIL